MTASLSTEPVATDSDVRLKSRFTQVARAARDNLSVGIDLVMVHNERSVKGRQPRASLNRSIVVTAPKRASVRV